MLILILLQTLPRLGTAIAKYIGINAMKSILKATALCLAVALPGVLAAETLGPAVPAFLAAGPIFGLLVASLVVLTFVSDYAPASALPTRQVPASHGKAAHPLAA
jgi:hypothetical protein